MGNEVLGLPEILLPHFTDEEPKSREKASSLPDVASRAEKAVWLVPHRTLTCLAHRPSFSSTTPPSHASWSASRCVLLSCGDAPGLPADCWEGSGSVGHGYPGAEALTVTVLQLLERGGLVRPHRR